MSLPDEIGMSITTEGMTFEFRVRALPEGCSRMFPDLGYADEFRQSRDLRAAVAQVAASVLDEAVSRFVAEFGWSLSCVLMKALDGEKVSPASTAEESLREAA